MAASGAMYIDLTGYLLISFLAQDAFLQIGEALQKRRKTDLYETASYFTGTRKDPALEDTELQTKLTHNQQYHDRIKELIEKYVQCLVFVEITI